ncbi:MAG: putative oxidoreductase [Ilumatobacteraceae bacterium]|nr:putative oxidoreductase [Ilumatobacteraceae bacterium]
MSARSRDGGSRITIGVLYPRAWYGDAAAFDDEIRRLTELDDRIDVVVEGYVEPHERRGARQVTDQQADLPPAPELTDAQRAAFAAIDIALAMDLPTGLTELAPKLQWVQSVGAGVNHLEAKVASASARLTTNGGSNAIGIAEFAFGRLLEHWKRFGDIRDVQSEHRWVAVFGRQVAGCTLGLLGFGPINQAVAARASAFGMRILVVRRSPGATPPGVERVVGAEGLIDVLGECDAVIAAVPETPASIGMIGAGELAAMRPGAFFCNVGRGTLVDESALLASLRSGHLGGAAIDVTTIEPLAPDDPLWTAPRLQISAHCSSVPSAMFPTVHRNFRANVARFLADEPLADEVDLDHAS